MGFWRKQQITFFLTSQCNLRCRYCYMPKMHVETTDRVIDLDFAIAGLRDFFLPTLHEPSDSLDQVSQPSLFDVWSKYGKPPIRWLGPIFVQNWRLMDISARK